MKRARERRLYRLEAWLGVAGAGEGQTQAQAIGGRIGVSRLLLAQALALMAQADRLLAAAEAADTTRRLARDPMPAKCCRGFL